jgi:endonuclease/exonuclease/phosphatase (EEP) superfamily protein YafD
MFCRFILGNTAIEISQPFQHKAAPGILRPLRAPLRRGLLLLACLTLTACAASSSTPVEAVPDTVVGGPAEESLAVDVCRSELADAHPAAGTGLQGDNIRLVNWNMKKKSIPNWRQDYKLLTSDKDLVLIQEASLRVDTINAIPTIPYWSFAPGYRTEDSITGVLTLSSALPATRCSFVTTEPLLRTPKATSITQFGLVDSDQTLVVVNVHAVNFSLGLGTYKRQFAQIAEVLRDHAGPIILSGDLNTWRDGRMETIEALAADLGLEALKFADDHRKTVLGHPLDHIFVRGLSASKIEVRDVSSSDHNPMTVTLSIWPAG